MDTAAYMSKESWEVLLDEYNWNVVDLRDRRYDGVIHMVSAAIGAEKFYTTENNAARIENINEARDVDFKIINAWVGHPQIRIIDNSTDFKTKIKRVEDAICQIIGAPRPAKGVRKFILNDDLPKEMVEKLPIKFETFEVEQTYLQPSSEDVKGYNYLRRRIHNGMYTYTHSVFYRKEGDDQQVIIERSISGRDYVGLMKQSDPKRTTVRKKVLCFLWNNHYFQIHTYLNPDIKLTVLHIESEDPDKSIDFPWFINVKGEVTNISEFSSYYIAEQFSNNDQHNLSWKSNQLMVDIFGKVKKEHEEKKKPN